MNTDDRSPTLMRDLVSDAEWKVRTDLAACYRLVATLRHERPDLQPHHGQGAGQGRALPDQPVRAAVHRDHRLVLLHDRPGTATSCVKPDTEFPINRAGFMIHSAIHGARADLHCVMHTHTRAGMAVSAMKDGLLPLTQTAMRFYGAIGYHDYEVPDRRHRRARAHRARPRPAQRDDPAQPRPGRLRPHGAGHLEPDVLARDRLQGAGRRARPAAPSRTCPRTNWPRAWRNATAPTGRSTSHRWSGRRCCASSTAKTLPTST